MINKHSFYSRSIVLSITLLALLPVVVSVRAQPDVHTTSILFEPRPIPETEAEAIPLVSFSNLSEQIGNAPVIDRGLTARERLDIEDSIREYVIAIGDQESEEGPYSEDLREDLFSAGQLAEQLGDYSRALNFYQRTQNVIRVNQGLETLSQIPVMEAITNTYKELDKLRDADDTQRSILELVQNEYGEQGIGTIPTMLSYGIWNMDAFLDRSNILLNVKRMNVAQFMNDPMNYIQEGSNLRDTPLFNLYQAQQSFLHAIDILIENKQYFHPQIIDLEKMLLKTYLLSMHRENILYEPDFYLTRKKRKTGSRLNTNAIELMESEEYQLGQDSHTRIISYIANNPERTNAQLANAMLEAADWHLLFERKVKAAKEYQKVYDFYNENPEAGSEVQATLYPEYPVILPVYLPPPNSREKLGIGDDEDVNYFGYFDVSFRINKFGKAKRVEILDKGGEVTRNMEIRLNQYLQKVLFRPIFKDGKPDTDTLRLRYYVGI